MVREMASCPLRMQGRSPTPPAPLTRLWRPTSLSVRVTVPPTAMIPSVTSPPSCAFSPNGCSNHSPPRHECAAVHEPCQRLGACSADNALPERHHHRLRPVLHTEFLQDTMDVCLDRAFRDT